MNLRQLTGRLSQIFSVIGALSILVILVVTVSDVIIFIYTGVAENAERYKDFTLRVLRDLLCENSEIVRQIEYKLLQQS